MTKVLVVEDEFAVLEALSNALELEGFEIVRAGDGVQGLAALKTQTFDLVLCDEIMPLLNGRDLVKTMQSHPTWREIAVILMSEVPAQKRDWSIVVLRKPISLRELLAVMRHRLNLDGSDEH